MPPDRSRNDPVCAF
jgi:hypothetical protein